MTTGENLIIRGVMKPIATLYKPLESVNIDTKESYEASVERSDTCAVPAACVIAENSLSSNIIQKFVDAYIVFKNAENRNFIITIYYVIRLSVYYLIKKIKQKIS